MIKRARSIALLVAWPLLFVSGRAQAQMTPQEMHDRIVAVYSPRAHRPLPAGDTLVSWYGNPVLFHTVRRGNGEVATGMLRADSLLGTALVTWRHDRPASGDVRWTHGDSIEVDVRLVVDGDTLPVSGREPRGWLLPKIPWAIADYGMEDLAVPLLKSLDFRGAAAVTIAAYRPYGAKWDTLQVTENSVGDGVLYQLRGSDSKRDWWLVSRDGALVRLTREGQEFERRPLEQTALFNEYRRLRALLKQ